MNTLNLGAGNRILDGAVNHDLRKHRPEIDIAHDLNVTPWPWPDAHFDKVIAISVFEHLDIDLVRVFDECHRILKRGGVLVVKLPLWDSERAHDDPTHRWFYTLRSIDQFCPDTRRGKQYGFYTTRKWRYLKRPKRNEAGTSIHATLEAL